MSRLSTILVSSVVLGSAACGSKAPPADAQAGVATTVAPAPADAAAPAPADDAAAPAPEADAVAAPADTTAPATAPRYFLGRVALPTGLPLKILLTQTGPTAATVDIPLQHLAGLAVTEVAVSDAELRFTLLPPGAPPAAANKFVAARAAGAEAYEGAVEAGGMKLPVRFVAVAGPDALVAKRPQTPAAPFPYKTEDLKIEVEGASLGCTLDLPTRAAAAPSPAVVFLTGSGLQDRDETIFDHKPFLVLADALARVGVASLRCDDRGTGQSTGDPKEVDAGVFAADARAMLAAVRARPEVDPKRVGLLGHSEGGMTAAAVAKGEGDALAFVVTLSGPALTGREILVRQNADQILSQGVKAEARDAILAAVDAYFGAIADGKPKEARDATVKALSERVAQAMEGEGERPTAEQLAANFSALADTKWLKGFLNATPAADLAASKARLLALFGERDTQVRAEENVTALRVACQASKKENFEVLVVPGANHLYQDAKTGEIAEYDEIEQTMAPATVERIAQWVATTTGAEKP